MKLRDKIIYNFHFLNLISIYLSFVATVYWQKMGFIPYDDIERSTKSIVWTWAPFATVNKQVLAMFAHASPP